MPQHQLRFWFERATEMMWWYCMIEPPLTWCSKFCAERSCKPFLILEHFTIVRCCLRMMSMVFSNDFSSMFAFSWFPLQCAKKCCGAVATLSLLLSFFFFFVLLVEMSFIYVIGNHCKWGVNLLLYNIQTAYAYTHIQMYSWGVCNKSWRRAC